MSVEKLSINRSCAVLGGALLLFTAAFGFALYRLTGSTAAVWCALLFAAAVLLCAAIFILLIRRKLTAFSDALCQTLDAMLRGETLPAAAPRAAEEESLFYKLNHRLAQLYTVLQENQRSVARERADLQELISDISHQVKTPIANLKAINATLLEQPVPPEKQRNFLLGMGGQLDQLDFLMQALVKTSRLESGVISLEKKAQPLYDTLAAALGGILLAAESKRISVEVHCPETFTLSHDRKWTGEALFNILDNAVKYTPPGGHITVAAECWELYLKIDIRDTGRGIAEGSQGAIFKRFYREPAVHDTPGIGIGLYLAREIITLQGGYIRVSSRPGHGAVFSVFLPRA